MKSLSYASLLILMIAFTNGCNMDQKLDTAYKRSVAWLWEQQSSDGGWHSKTHAVLRDGRALTPYILYYLLQVPVDIYPRKAERLRKGIEFIRKDMMASMIMNQDSILEFNYPNYSAAYALRLLHETNTDTLLQKRIAHYLLQQQFLESRGIKPEQLAYGGWGYGEPDLKSGEYGHVDLSHTRRITEALIETGFLDSALIDTPVNPVVKEEKWQRNSINRIDAVTVFLQGAQRSHDDNRLYEGCFSRLNLPYDGGFVSSMATLPTNKCQPVIINGAGLYYPSYATATCDGLLALHALGLTKSKAYRDAKQWLKDHQQIEVIDGLSPDDAEQWYLVMHYYHFSVRAEAMTKAGIQGPWLDQMKSALLREQQPGGFYVNPMGGVNKEDDPLMSTIFCVQAFNNILIQQA
jgi:hypothetical protein